MNNPQTPLRVSEPSLSFLRARHFEGAPAPVPLVKDDGIATHPVFLLLLLGRKEAALARNGTIPRIW